ncbi:MAG: EAL domain-containing protein [Rhodocyclaceae bacterium]|nr:EAL domain-containing protein [Rhodocyclaceae bacterium]
MSSRPLIEVLGARLAVALAVLAAPLAVWQMLPIPEWRVPYFLSWHLLIEVVSIVVALMIAVAALLRAPGDTARQFALGFGFLVVAVLDFLHLASYPDLPDFLTPNTPHKAIVFWLGARFAVAATLLALLWPWLARRFAWPALGWALFVCAAGFELLPAPTFYAEGRLTTEKIALEGGVVLAYLLLAAHFWRRRPDVGVDSGLLAQGLLVLAAGETFFTLYREVSGTANLLGHLYKFAGEAWFFRAIVLARFSRPYALLEKAAAAHAADAARYKTLFESAPEGVLAVAQDGRIVAANTAAHQMFVAPPGALPGRPLTDLIPEEVRAHHARLVADYFAAPHVRPMAQGRDLQAQRFDGKRVFVDIALAPIEIDGQLHALAFLRDASERVQAQRALFHVAHFDRLTGLPNRHSLLQELSKRLSGGSHGVVACFDLDGLARINHVFGHQIGDRLIQAAAHRLREALLADEYLARFEGDEFVLLLPDGVDPEKRLNAMLALLSVEFALPPSLSLTISATAGYARFPEDGIAAELLLQYAELAMFQAKRSLRRGVALFDHATPKKSARYLDLANRMREALARSEFRIVLQPRVKADGRPAGFEALLRWQSANEPISPGEFVPIAEDTGFIAELGAFALQEACRVAADWRAKGLAFGGIAVNLAPRQLANPALCAEIGQTLAHFSLPPSAIEIEVTESTAMGEEHWIGERLCELAAAGFRIALDDFGTGYSSLARLTALPVKVLKIDIAFVRRIGTAEGEGIVRAILSLARTLKLETVAEGVETAAQKAWLIAHGCDEYQGYLESPPLEVAAAEAWLRARLFAPGSA